MFVNTFYLEIKNLESCKILFLPLIYLNLFARRNFRESIKLVYFARTYCRKQRFYTVLLDTQWYGSCCLFSLLRVLYQKIFKMYQSSIWKWGKTSPANIYLLKVNNRNTGKRYKICSKLTIATTIATHLDISHLVLEFLLLTLSWVGSSQIYMMEFLVNYTYGWLL